ncbi:Maf family protein [Paludisphaera borealis]|uniref:7-methyl-GTP pyrophosphatase n=1 Tax=Paludisphaera borealis TaxID=1387353 RepID=A0A1U7CVM1_9BACT|nr:nucleoside triphosphate pyrophosphatase [Paludisphaera borealis]APW62997.1 Maf-like protein YceF [Paludisphaera borealis]
MNPIRRPEVVLASTSPYRRALMERLGIPFRCEPPNFDESSVAADELSPRLLAETLAIGKAESLSRLDPTAVVVGCDQIVHLEGRILGKPGGIPQAVAQLEAMSGRMHELITAMVVISGEQRFAHTDVARLRMRRLDRRRIERYVESDQPLDCAGSYKIEERGVVLFERIESEDFTAITGLPLLALTRILAELGFETP